MTTTLSNIPSAPAPVAAPYVARQPTPIDALVIMPLAEQRGGGELMLLHLMQEGRDAGIRWGVIFLEDGPMVAQVRALDVRAWVVEAGRLRQPVRFVRAVRGIRRIVRSERAAVVLSWMGKAQLYGGIAAALSGVPAVWYQLGEPTPKNLMDVFATLLPARVIMTCAQAGAAAQHTLWPRRPVRVVHPGVELDRFDPSKLPPPAEARRQLGLPESGPIIGIVGRLQHWKGMHVLIEAMPAILAKHPHATALIVGGEHRFEPEYAQALRDLTKKLNLESRVRFAGLQQNVPLWMTAMDVFVHASEREPFGIVIVEAMALGKPVVAGNAGGPTEIITDGLHGLLTPFGDADALSAAVLRYLGDPAFAARVAVTGAERARDFSTQRYAQGVISAVREFIGQPAAAEASPR